ncbi:MAG: C10 family peptidase, partial [Allobaculum sp.]|nr:C10 family peptidase [Allobaculum sp.]
ANNVSRSITRNVKESFLYSPSTSRSIDNDTILYIVNTSPYGFAIVKADESIEQPIFAYSLTSEISSDYNPAFEWYMNQAIEKMRNLSFTPSSRAKQPNTGSEDLYTEYYMGILCYRKVTSTNKSQTGPLLHTAWSQNPDPYNRYCYTPQNQRSYSGCVATAIGQIFAYHSFPDKLNDHYYNWNDMLTYENAGYLSENGKNCVGHLLKDIGKYVNMVYTTTSAYPDKGTSIPNALRSMGYNCGELCSFSDAMISQSLHSTNPKPIYMRGTDKNEKLTGHAWVLDGDNVEHHTFDYIGVDDGIKYGSGQSTLGWYHFNWGWNGYQNGFFEVNLSSVGVDNDTYI